MSKAADRLMQLREPDSHSRVPDSKKFTTTDPQNRKPSKTEQDRARELYRITSQPNAGTIQNLDSDKSAVSRPAEYTFSKEDRGKAEKLTSEELRKAHQFNERSENGKADPTGGW